MSNSANLVIQFAQEPVSFSAYDLVIEQKKWGANVGYMSKVDFIKFLGNMFFGNLRDDPTGVGGGLYGSSPDCGMSNGGIDTAVWVYPSYQDMPYNIDVTHGTLGAQKVERVTMSEIVTLNMDNVARPSYPVFELLGAIKQGELYDKNGSLLLNVPPLSVVNGEIRLSQNVYGSIRIFYNTIRHEYPVRIESRNIGTTPENFFSSVAYAWFTGGVRHVVLNPPAGAEEFAGSGAGCGHGSKTIIEGSGGAKPKHRPVGVQADRKIEINYCKGEVTSDTVTEEVFWEDIS